MIDKIKITHAMVIVGTNELDFDLIEQWCGINVHLQRLMEYAYGLWVDKDFWLHYDDDHFAAIVHIIKNVPPTFRANDVFDEESMDNVCTLIDYIEEKKAKHDPMKVIKKHFFDFVKDETGDELNDYEIKRWIVDYISCLEENSVHQPDDVWTEFMNHKIKEQLE